MPESTFAPAPFPSTLWSQVLALQGNDLEQRRARMERLIGDYWRPVYWAIHCQGRIPRDEARDLTQDFFVEILEGRVIEGVDPGRGSFRSYLKGALKNFLLDESRKTNREKRGGGRKPLSLDFDSGGIDPPDLGQDPARALDRMWALQVLDEAVKDLESALAAAGRSRDAEIFRAYDLAGPVERPSYAEMAARFGVEEREVWNVLRSCRSRLHDALLKRIGPYVRNETELFSELRELFGR